MEEQGETHEYLQEMREFKRRQSQAEMEGKKFAAKPRSVGVALGGLAANFSLNFRRLPWKLAPIR